MKKSSADNHHGDVPPRQRWVTEVLFRAGATLLPDTLGIYTCALGEEISRFLGRDSIRLTFQRKTAMAGEADLAVPGSWFHDQLIRFARERGRVAMGYLGPRGDLDRDRVVSARRGEGTELLDLLEKRYGSILVFTFRVFYYTDPAEEEVLHIGYDAERGRIVRRSLPRMVAEARGVPEEDGFAPAPRPDVSTAFAAVWNVVQDEVEGHVRELEETGRSAHEARIRTVESYYRQLLAEEKRLLESRASRKGQDESKGRIDLLKVEWERRMKEEADRLRPQVVARLSATATLHMPLERWRVSRGNGHGGEGELWLDLARGEAWDEGPAGRSDGCEERVTEG